MATIRAVCPTCKHEIDLLPHEIAVHVPSSDTDRLSGRYAFTCSMCDTFGVKSADERAINLLLAGGVQVVTAELAPWERSLHPEFPPDGPELTVDDLLDFHLLLRTDDWFDQLLEMTPR